MRICFIKLVIESDKNITSSPDPNFELFSVKKLLGKILKLFITKPSKPITKNNMPKEKYGSIFMRLYRIVPTVDSISIKLNNPFRLLIGYAISSVFELIKIKANIRKIAPYAM